MRRVPVLLVAGLLLSACAAASPTAPPGPLPRGRLSIATAQGGASLSVEIARTDAARRYGLMNRRSLPADAGMAFLFDGPVEEGFWMKDTLIPLSIAFWGEDHRILTIVEMVPCGSGPCPVSTATAAYVGAVEANAGWFGRHGVRIGDRVLLVQTP